MSLVQLIVVLVIVGVALWAINAYVPMDPKIKGILNVVVVIAVLLWLLAGLFPGVGPDVIGSCGGCMADHVVVS